MSHGITATDHMFSVRETPWHGLGEVLTDYPTREEAQRIAHPWEPIAAPVYRKVPFISEDGALGERFEEIDGFKAVEHSDNGETLSIMPDTRGLITNSEMWDVAEAVGKVGTDTFIETAGSLNGGRQTWILLTLAEPIHIKGDPNGGTVCRLALQNSNDGSGSFRGQGINTRVVCQNTSLAGDAEAKRNGFEFAFRHSTNVAEKIKEAMAAVAEWRAGTVAWQHAMDHLAATPVTASQRELFVQKFQPLPKVPDHMITDRVRGNVEKARAELRSIFDGPTQEGISLTSFGLFQAGIEWSQHYRPVKGTSDRARMENHFKRHIMTDGGLRKSILALAQEVVHA